MPAKRPSTRSSGRNTKRASAPWETPTWCPLSGCHHFAPDLNMLVDHLVSEKHRPVPERKVKKEDVEEVPKKKAAVPREVCLMCGFRTGTIYDLRAHYNAEVGALPFECGVHFQVINPNDPSSAVLVKCPYRSANNPNMHNHRSDWHGIRSIYQIPSKEADKENSKKLRRKPTPTKPYDRPEASQEKQRARRKYPNDAFWTMDTIFGKLKWFTNFPSEKKKFEEELDRALEEQEPIPVPPGATVFDMHRRRSADASSSSRKSQRLAGHSASSPSSSSPSSSPPVYPKLSFSRSSSSSSSSSPTPSLWDFSQDDAEYDGYLDSSVPSAPAHPAFFPDILSYTYNHAMPLPWTSGSACDAVAPPNGSSDAPDAVSLDYEDLPENLYAYEDIDAPLVQAPAAPLDIYSHDFEDENQEFYDFGPEDAEYAPPSVYPQYMVYHYPESQPVAFEPVDYSYIYLPRPY